MIYTDIKNGRFYNEDCFDAMREIPDGVIDLCITSPPYDNMRSYNNSLEWNFEKFCSIAKQLTRLICEGGIIVWIIGDQTINGSESGSSFKQTLFFKDFCDLRLHDTMIWNKGGFSAVGSLQTRYAPVFEYMFVFSKGKPKTFNPIKDRPNINAGRKITGTNRLSDGSLKPMTSVGQIIKEYGQRFNIWEIDPVRQQGDDKHPAPFPLNIARDHILSWSNEGDCILDPFGGSGTTAIAAINTNRKWVCIEKEKEYYDKAIERIINHAL